MIYDCFPFFNELDLLEIRLNHLNPIVDYFVLVEGIKTFTNKNKPLDYENNKDRFKAFSNKIIHIIVNEKDYPQYKGDPWEYEFFQRNSIMRGLISCKAEDTILISDVDEIPDPEVILRCKDFSKIYFFKQKHYNIFLNTQYLNQQTWFGTVMLPFSKITTPEHIRTCKIHFKKNRYLCILKKNFYFLTLNRNRFQKWSKICVHQVNEPMQMDNGGWHFSYIGGPEMIALKLQSYAHQEFNTFENTDLETIKGKISDKTYCCFDKNEQLITIPIDESFPLFLRNNIERYKHLINA